MQAIFQKYGKIECIRMFDGYLYDCGFGYALINYKNGRNVIVELLDRKDGYIQAFQTPQFPPTQSKKTENALFKAPARDSSLNIVNMKIDCLIEIFERLPRLEDLASAADVCHKFNNVARRIASNRLINEIIICDFKTKLSCKWPTHLLCSQNIFRQFCNEIRTVDLRFEPNSSSHGDVDGPFCYQHFYQMAVLTTLVTYCSSETSPLTTLKISGMNIPCDWREKFQPIFARIQRLDVYHSTIGDLLTDCKELIDLRIEFTPFESSGFLSQIQPEKLQTLHLTGFWPWCATQIEVKNFFGRLVNLKELRLKNFDESIFKLIMDSLVEANSPIESLEIECFKKIDNVVIENMLKLQQIKNLDIVASDLDNGQLLKLVNYLPNLEEMTIHVSSKASIRAAKLIIETVPPKRMHILKLKCSKQLICECCVEDFVGLLVALLKFVKTVKIQINDLEFKVMINSEVFSGEFALSIRENAFSKYKELLNKPQNIKSNK